MPGMSFTRITLIHDLIYARITLAAPGARKRSAETGRENNLTIYAKGIFSCGRLSGTYTCGILSSFHSFET